MTLNDFLTECSREQGNNPGLRWGQAVFNTLHKHNPNLAAEIHGTPLDPFYAPHDSDLTPLFVRLSERWDSTYLG